MGAHTGAFTVTRFPATARLREALALAGVAAEALALGAVVGVVAALTVPALFGVRSFTVMSESMDPTIAMGDLVVTRSTAPGELAIGDVVTFHDPQRSGRLLTHRVRALRYRDGTAYVTTKGDATNAVEKWTAPMDGSVGRVFTRVPKLGYALVWTRSPLGLAAVVLLPTLLLAGWALVRIWRPARG